MSLINQMLQDLEKREAAPLAGAVVPGQVRAVARRASAPSVWWALPLLLAAAIGGWLLLRPAAPVLERTVPRPAAGLPVPPPSPSDAPVGEPVLQSSLQLSTLLLAARNASAPEQPVAAPQPATPPAAPRHPEPGRAAPALVVSAELSTAPAKAEREQPAIDKRPRELSPQQQAENEYRKAIALLQLGRVTQASSGLERTLQLDPQHVAARQTLVGLLVEGKRYGEAEQLLHTALQSSPEQTGFAATLARLQVERGGAQEALDTLQRSLPHAADKPDYRAFMAALLQRLERHKEAVEHYQAALRRGPQSGLWLMGLGISLQAENRPAEAREAYTRARASGTLTPELQAFVEQRLRQLP
jgi:MSHA biogenesis protein MshN